MKETEETIEAWACHVRRDHLGHIANHCVSYCQTNFTSARSLSQCRCAVVTNDGVMRLNTLHWLAHGYVWYSRCYNFCHHFVNNRGGTRLFKMKGWQGPSSGDWLGLKMAALHRPLYKVSFHGGARLLTDGGGGSPSLHSGYAPGEQDTSQTSTA